MGFSFLFYLGKVANYMHYAYAAGKSSCFQLQWLTFCKLTYKWSPEKQAAAMSAISKRNYRRF